MPRISDRYLRCAVYIYESREDAELGIRQGGSGFTVAVPFDNNPAWSELYVVTNRHIIVDPETLGTRDVVIRMNRKDGAVEYFETKFSDWTPHPDGDDVAVIPLRFQFEDINLSIVMTGDFVTHDTVDREDIGIGDDTFMVGRFINHEGKQQNAPAVRFGSIAMMPTEKITSPYGLEQESFLVEVRSLPGYSGSAVFLYSSAGLNDMSVRRRGYDRPDFGEAKFPMGSEKLERFTSFMDSKGPFLLGIDWCHIPRKSYVLNAEGKRIDGSWHVEENTGMAGVIPAWKIAELLNCEELQMRRNEADRELTMRKKSSPVSLDSAEAQGDERKPFTRGDFEAALKKASRKVTED